MTVEPESGSQTQNGERGSSFLVVDENPDHALLIAEILTSRHPGAKVSVMRGAPRHVDSGAVIISTNTDPDALLPVLDPRNERRPRLVLVDGPGSRWSEEARAHLAPDLVADKRDVARLEDVLAEVTGVPRRSPRKIVTEVQNGEGALPPPVLDEPPSRAEPAPAPSAAREVRAVQTKPAIGVAFPAEARERERELLIAGILAGEVREILVHLEPLSRLFSMRAPGDEAISRYAESLRGEVRRAAAIVARIQALATVSGPPSPPRSIDVARFLRLRLAAWKAWLPGDVAITVDADPNLPLVDAWAEVLGPVIDDLLGLVFGESAPGSALAVKIASKYLPAAAGSDGAESRPAGRCVALLIEGAGGETRRREKTPEATARLVEHAELALKAHGGDLRLEEDGTARVVGVALLLPESTGRRVVVAEDERRLPRRSILVVDDDEDIRSLADEMLRLKGYTVTTVSSGEEAVARFRRGCRHDLVVLDLQMKGLDGRATFHEINKIDPNVRAMLMSGSATGVELRRLLADGLLGFLPKPFSLRQLLESVEGALLS